MTVLYFQLLGGCEVSFTSGIQPPLRAKKARALLAYLAMHKGARVARTKLAFLLWSDRSEQQARRSLRQTLSVLRKFFAGDQPSPLVIERNSIMLNASEVDANKFAQFAQSNEPQNLAAANELYKGSLFAGFVTGSPEFDEWIECTRREYQDVAYDILGKLLDHNLASGQHKFAINNLTGLLQIDPYCEEHHRTLMKIYAARNEKNRALRQFNVCEEILLQDLQVKPEPATRQLVAKIRDQQSVSNKSQFNKVSSSDRSTASHDAAGDGVQISPVLSSRSKSRWKQFQSFTQVALVACSAVILGHLLNNIYMESGRKVSEFVAAQTVSPSYDAYVIGKYLTTSQTPVGHLGAINYFKRSLKLDPAQTQARAALANAYIDVYIKHWQYKEGLPKPSEAYKLAFLNAEIATKSSNPPALAQIVLAKTIYFGPKGSQVYDDAISYARLAVEIEPDSAEAYFGLGQILVLGGNARQAVPYLQRAQLMDPTIAKLVEYELALAYFHMDQFNTAAMHIERALVASPEAYYIWTLAAATYALLYEDERAVKAITRAGKLSIQQGKGPISITNYSGRDTYIRAIDEHRMSLGLQRACRLFKSKA